MVHKLVSPKETLHKSGKVYMFTIWQLHCNLILFGPCHGGLPKGKVQSDMPKLGSSLSDVNLHLACLGTGLDLHIFLCNIVNIFLPLIFSIWFGCSKEPSR